MTCHFDFCPGCEEIKPLTGEGLCPDCLVMANQHREEMGIDEHEQFLGVG